MMIGYSPDMILIRQALRGKDGMGVPYYKDSGGLIIAEAFADKLLDLMN